MNQLHKVGLVVNTCGPAQLPFQLITSANRMLAKRQDVDVSLFYKQLQPYIVQPNFATYHFFETFNYTGHLVTTDMFSTARVVSYPGPNRSRYIYFYDVNLDYLHLPQKQYESLRNIYCHPKVRLIARSESHSKILTSTFQKPIAVVPDCNVEKLVDVIIESELVI